MLGDGSADGRGIIPRLVDAIFTGIAQSSEQMEFTVKLSYVEIYNEKIKDLAAPTSSSSASLKIREGPRGVYIEGVSERYVSSYAEVLALLSEGSAHRAVSATLMNSESSRSHSVFLLTLAATDKLTGSQRSSKLTLIDLAGSEKVLKTGAVGSTLDEAKHINRSLSALGNVINALSVKAKHVPYRDSKLTRLLSDSLGGNSQTCLIITCSPMSFNLEETLSTLRFGSRAKLIKNKPTMNAERSVAEYRRMLDTAQQQIQWQQEIIVGLEGDVQKLKAFCGQHGLVVPVLSGMSGEGITVRMKVIEGEGAEAAGGQAEEEPDAESAEVMERAEEESKQAPPTILAVTEGHARRTSQTDLSTLPSRLAALSSQLSEVTAERGRLLDVLADREEEMKEAEEIHRTERELIELQVRELVGVAEEGRRWRTEAEVMRQEHELLKKKVEVLEKDHQVRLAEVKEEVDRSREEKRRLQAKLTEAALELQRQRESRQAEEQYRPPAKREDKVKDDLHMAALTINVPPTSEPPITPGSPAPTGSALFSSLTTGQSLSTTPSPSSSSAPSPSSSSPASSLHISPVVSRVRHQRMKSQTLKKGDLSHPLSMLPHTHSRNDSTASLSSTLDLLKDDSTKVTTLTSALSKKVSQYLALKEAYCNSNDHIAMLEMALQDANARIKEVGDGQRGRIEVLERKLAEAEAVCQRLLVLERSKRGSAGVKELRDLTAGLGVMGGGGSGHGGTIVVPVQAVVSMSGGKQRKPSSGGFSLFR